MEMTWANLPTEWLLYHEDEVPNFDQFSNHILKESGIAGRRAIGYCLWMRNAAGNLTKDVMMADAEECGREYARIIRLPANMVDLSLATCRLVPKAVAERGDIRYAMKYGIEMPTKWVSEYAMRDRLAGALDSPLVGRNSDTDSDTLLAWHLGRAIRRYEDFLIWLKGVRRRVEEKADHSRWVLDKPSHFRPGYSDGHRILFTHFDGMGDKNNPIPDTAIIRTWILDGKWIEEHDLVNFYAHKRGHAVPHGALIKEPMVSEYEMSGEEAKEYFQIFIDNTNGDGWHSFYDEMMHASLNARNVLMAMFNDPNRVLKPWQSCNRERLGTTIELSDDERQMVWNAIYDI